MEHNSVLRPLLPAGDNGEQSCFRSCGERGGFTVKDWRQPCGPILSAVVQAACVHLTGNSVDLKRIGNFCREHNLLFIVDASQTREANPGEIDMQAMNIDVLVCFTGHSICTVPSGTGGFVSEDCISPLKSGGRYSDLQ